MPAIVPLDAELALELPTLGGRRVMVTGTSAEPCAAIWLTIRLGPELATAVLFVYTAKIFPSAGTAVNPVRATRMPRAAVAVALRSAVIPSCVPAELKTAMYVPARAPVVHGRTVTKPLTDAPGVQKIHAP